MPLNRSKNSRQNKTPSTLIVSMYHDTLLMPNINDKNTKKSTTLIFAESGRKQFFYFDYTVGIVWKADEVNIESGYKQDANTNIIQVGTKEDLHTVATNLKNKKLKNPAKIVHFSPTGNEGTSYTDYTRWNDITKEVVQHRSNEEALELFAEKINRKQIKDNAAKREYIESGERYNELVITRQKETNDIHGLILDFSLNINYEGFSVMEYNENILKEIFQKNPTFNLYIFDNGNIKVIKNSDVINFLDQVNPLKQKYNAAEPHVSEDENALENQKVIKESIIELVNKYGISLEEFKNQSTSINLSALDNTNYKNQLTPHHPIDSKHKTKGETMFCNII